MQGQGIEAVKVIALAQQKGGVGKSTLAIHMAVELVRRGLSVAIIDMDPQNSVAKWAKRRDAEQPLVMTSDLEHLSGDLAELRREGVAFVLLDLPGRSSSIVNEGMKAANLVIIPAPPFDIDIEASVDTIETARRLKRRYVFVMNGVPPKAGRTQEFVTGLTKRGQPVLPGFIGRRLDYPDAIAEGLGVAEYAPKGKAAEEIGEFTNAVLERLEK
jgi:chromosome partitioning protein